MSENEEVTAGSDSFFEVGQYKRTVQRHENGIKACNDLMALIQDRADIEKHYAKELKSWNKKWLDNIEKGPEYATMAGAIKGMLEESESLADVHLDMKSRLLAEVQATVKQWQKENYTKSVIGAPKETKVFEDDFRKAQKAWAKKMGKVQKAKSSYHNACKLEKTAINQESNARSDSGVSPDQLKKAQDKAEKARREVLNTKEKYNNALEDLNAANPRYMEDMTEIFNKCQHEEEKRLTFMKEMLFGFHKCLDPKSYPKIERIYERMSDAISSADESQNLRWWSLNHGVDMPMNWPAFEEYSPELHAIHRKEKKAHSSDPITMTSIKHKSTPVAAGSTAQSSNNHTPHTTPPPSNRDRVDDFGFGNAIADLSDEEVNHKPPESAANPFGEDEEWDEGPVDDGSAGVPVRALYDYDGQEADELSFKVGDVFVKIKDKDDQGWCTGRKDGVVGLYPDNYCQPITE